MLFRSLNFHLLHSDSLVPASTGSRSSRASMRLRAAPRRDLRLSRSRVSCSTCSARHSPHLNESRRSRSCAMEGAWPQRLSRRATMPPLPKQSAIVCQQAKLPKRFVVHHAHYSTHSSRCRAFSFRRVDIWRQLDQRAQHPQRVDPRRHRRRERFAVATNTARAMCCVVLPCANVWVDGQESLRHQPSAVRAREVVGV